MLTLDTTIDVELAPRIAYLCQQIARCPDVREVTPSYTTILVESHSRHTSLEQLGQTVLDIAGYATSNAPPPVPDRNRIELPVYYAPEVGPDLETVARTTGLSVDEVIALHSERTYTVCAVGFAPGFAYLAPVDDRLALPRLASPRARVPAGSVAIAESQTAVYPAASPGGWHLIGNCPLPLVDPTQEPPSPFTIGDEVQFVPIDRATYLEQGGHV